jgi:uncharacterized protein YceK
VKGAHSLLCLLACLLFGVSGCGTFDSLVVERFSDDPRPPSVYSGVKFDVETAAWSFDSDQSTIRPLLGPVGGCFAIVDVPLSAIADTVVLPITVTWTLLGPRPVRESDGIAPRPVPGPNLESVNHPKEEGK